MPFGRPRDRDLGEVEDGFGDDEEWDQPCGDGDPGDEDADDVPAESLDFATKDGLLEAVMSAAEGEAALLQARAEKVAKKKARSTKPRR